MKRDLMRLSLGMSTLALSVVQVGAAQVGLAAPPVASDTLTYSRDSQSVVPLAGAHDVPTVVAEKWLLVTEQPEDPEGLIFDRNGNLHLVVVGHGSVLRSAPPYKELTTVFSPPAAGP